MSVISVRLNNDEETLLKKVADFEGIGLSSYIKKIVFERLEEEYDLKLAENAYKIHTESNQKTYSFESVVEELGIDL
ncbi:type II toxin-antitoxin system RelB family antitoxin [Cetobacterium sp.]|uniref:type II toxin-antitoxin system RelB family antitoxin n=1 Tax=Cetobacterium sp. TaxID=2071632 RepID=UPI003AF16603